MALSPITQFDFPNSSHYDSDLREVLKITHEVYTEYNTMYAGFQTLETNFATMQSAFSVMQAQLATLDDDIANEVATQLAAEMVAFTTKYNNLYSKVEDSFNAFAREYNSMVLSLKAMIEENLATSREELEALRDKIYAEWQELIDKYEWLWENVNQINKAYADGLYNTAKLDYDAQIQAVIEDYTAKFEALPVTQGFTILNPTSGNWEDVDTTVRNVYNALKYMQPNEVARMIHNKDIETIDEAGFTALSQDTRMMYILAPWWTTYSPYTGKYEPYRQVWRDIASAWSDDAITAQQYQDLGLTAEEYRDWQNASYYEGEGITARNFQFYSYGILTMRLKVNADLVRTIHSEIYKDEEGILVRLDYLEQGVKPDISELKAEVESVREDLTVLSIGVSNLSDSVDERISALDTRVTACETAISEIEDYGSRIADLENRTSAVEQKAESNQDILDANGLSLSTSISKYAKRHNIYISFSVYYDTDSWYVDVGMMMVKGRLVSDSSLISRSIDDGYTVFDIKLADIIDGFDKTKNYMIDIAYLSSILGGNVNKIGHAVKASIDEYIDTMPEFLACSDNGYLYNVDGDYVIRFDFSNTNMSVTKRIGMYGLLYQYE